jgi:flagellar biosynthesis/type III secretory pathway ATPase
MISVTSSQHRELASRLRHLLAAYRDAEDLIQVGAYVKGSDPSIDEAVARRAAIQAFLRQDVRETSTMTESLAGLDRALTEQIQ